MGIGIFSPRGPINYTYYEETGSCLVTAQVPKLNRRGREKDKQQRKNGEKKGFNKIQISEHTDEVNNSKNKKLEERKHLILLEDLSNYAQCPLCDAKRSQ